MRAIRFQLVTLLVWVLFAAVAHAANFKLADGRSITGDLIETGSDEATALIRVGGESYERIPWGQFSQEDLKGFVERYSGNKKIVEAAEPFIEVSQEERAARTEVRINPAPEVVVQMQQGRQEPRSAVILSLFQSGPGWFLMILVYAANIYAGVEIAVFRARPKALVAGLAAIPGAGLLSNIVFICMPTAFESKAEEEMAAAEAARHEPTPTIEIPGHAEEQAAAVATAAAEATKPEVYTRGKFTFNKRFFETKFAGFFGMTRSDENKPKVFIVKSTKGEFVVERITRITPADLFIMPSGANGEVSMHFTEIVEVILKPHA